MNAPQGWLLTWCRLPIFKRWPRANQPPLPFWGVRLLTLPAITAETRWESSFLCPGAVGVAGDPLGFITTASPPALSLIRPGQGAGSLLNRLAASCGSSIPTAEISKFLGADPLPGNWPEQLPVRCQKL